MHETTRAGAEPPLSPTPRAGAGSEAPSNQRPPPAGGTPEKAAR